MRRLFTTILLEDNGACFKSLTCRHITCLNNVTSESLDAETNESVKILTVALFIIRKTESIEAFMCKEMSTAPTLLEDNMVA